MHNIINSTFYSCIAALLFLGFIATGCSDNPSGINPVDIAVDVAFSDGYESSEAEGGEMTLTNVNSQETFEATINENGEATFQDLPSGSYDISVVLTLGREEVFNLTGNYPDEEEVTFNGSLSNITINPDTQDPTVELTAGRLGDLVIKQAYYAGSDIIDGAMFRDQFLEIYNNSNEAIDISGIYIMGAYGNRSKEGASYETETGQFDWNQSIGMPSDIDANDDYLYARWLYQIPDNGSEKMVEPGESIVIAQTALNHKEPFQDQDGDPVSVNNPELTVDLSNADYEVYLGDDVENVYPTDIDNPDVPNMENIFIFGRDLILDAPGREAYVIFRTDTEASEFESYPDPSVETVTNETTMYPQIPTEWVIDAVQIQPSPSNQVPKLLQDRLDAGYTFVPGGAFSSNSVIRIEAKQNNGRSILKDTNNSEEDFTFLKRAEPRVAAPTNANNAVPRLLAKPKYNQQRTYIDQLKSQWAPSVRR